VTTLNTRPFLYRETKTIASLIDQGLEDDQIKKQVVDDNLLGLQSMDRRNIGRWGNGDVEVGFPSLNDLTYIIYLVKQSYDWQMNSED